MPDEPTPPAPSAETKRKELHDQLGMAVGACLLSAALHATSIALNMANGFQAGFTLADGLALGAILPQFLVAGVLHDLGQYTKHWAIGVSGVGLLACGWLLQILMLCGEDFMPKWAQIVAGIVVFLGILAVAGMVGEHCPKGLREWSFGLPLLCYFLLRFLSRTLAAKLNLDFAASFGLITGGLLLLGLVLFTLWYGVLLVLRRERFGHLGVLVGLMHLAALGYFALAMTHLVNTALALLEQPGMNEQLFEQEFGKALTGLLSSALIYETLPPVLTALWFLALRSRLKFGEPEGGEGTPAPQENP